MRKAQTHDTEPHIFRLEYKQKTGYIFISLR